MHANSLWKAISIHMRGDILVVIVAVIPWLLLPNQTPIPPPPPQDHNIRIKQYQLNTSNPSSLKVNHNILKSSIFHCQFAQHKRVIYQATASTLARAKHILKCTMLDLIVTAEKEKKKANKDMCLSSAVRCEVAQHVFLKFLPNTLHISPCHRRVYLLVGCK